MITQDCIRITSVFINLVLKLSQHLLSLSTVVFSKSQHLSMLTVLEWHLKYCYFVLWIQGNSVDIQCQFG